MGLQRDGYGFNSSKCLPEDFSVQLFLTSLDQNLKQYSVYNQ